MPTENNRVRSFSLDSSFSHAIHLTTSAPPLLPTPTPTSLGLPGLLSLGEPKTFSASFSISRGARATQEKLDLLGVAGGKGLTHLKKEAPGGSKRKCSHACLLYLREGTGGLLRPPVTEGGDRIASSAILSRGSTPNAICLC